MASTIYYVLKGTDCGYYVYDLGAAVGMGGRNLPNDVLLVQTLLYIIFYTHSSKGETPPAGHTNLEINGSYNRATHIHLAHYKQLMRSNGARTPYDGKVDPFPPKGDFYRTRRGYAPVISMMNHQCDRIYMGEEKDFRLDLPNSGPEAFSVDSRLQQELAVNRRVNYL